MSGGFVVADIQPNNWNSPFVGPVINLAGIFYPKTDRKLVCGTGKTNGLKTVIPNIGQTLGIAYILSPALASNPGMKSFPCYPVGRGLTS